MTVQDTDRDLFDDALRAAGALHLDLRLSELAALVEAVLSVAVARE